MRIKYIVSTLKICTRYRSEFFLKGNTRYDPLSDLIRILYL